MHLDCPVCEWSGIVYYSTRRPTYCSGACKAKAWRRRKRHAQELNGVTFSRRVRQNNTVKTAYLEHQIAHHTARGDYSGAQALYDLAADIGAPIDAAVIGAIAAQLDSGKDTR